MVLPYPGCYSRFTVGVERCAPCAPVLSVAGFPSIPPYFPFHCWSVIPVPVTVSLLGTVNTLIGVAQTHGNSPLVPHNLLIPDIPARTNRAGIKYQKLSDPG